MITAPLEQENKRTREQETPIRPDASLHVKPKDVWTIRVRLELEDATPPSPRICNRRPPGSPVSRPSAPGGTCARHEPFRAISVDRRGHPRHQRLWPAGSRRLARSPPRRLGSAVAPGL